MRNTRRNTRLWHFATLLLLATCAAPSAVWAEPAYKVPTNAQECDQLYFDLIVSAGDAAATQHFLIGTNADKIMPELCKRASYQAAYDFAVPMIESNKKPMPQSAPPPMKDCFLGC